MKNRGQVTAFVILGFVILIVVIVLVYVSSTSLRKEEPLKETIIEGELSEVKGYITSCLEDSLKDAVSSCSGTFPGGEPKCSEYELDVSKRAKEYFCNCIPNCNDFSMFKNIQIDIKGEVNLKAKISGDKKKITLTMEYPLLVKKGGSEHMLGTIESPFVAEYMLEQRDCVPIKVIDYTSCIAAETKTVEVNGLILTYRKDIDRVAIGETCVAC